MPEDPTIQDNGGTSLDADIANLEPTTTGDEGADNANPDHEGKSAEQLRKERANAIQEAVKNSKQAKEARADADFYRTAYEVANNPDKILEIHAQNPELADRISKDKWGMSYDALIKKAQQEQETTNSNAFDEDAIEQIVEKKIKQRSAQKEQESIERFTTDFFLENDIELNGIMFKNIMEDYEELKPSTLKHAKKILKMLYEEHTGRTAQTDTTSMSATMPKSVSKSARKSSSYKDALEASRSLGFGLTEEDFKKYSK